MVLKNLPQDLQKYTFFNKLKQFSFVEKIILFGSRARGSQRLRSDIDVAIICPRATERDWQQVVDVIDDADTLLTIDCVRFDKADLELQQHILKDGIEL